ncbi:MAG: phage tail tube protein [Candidatus Bathyarchaeia archaeon]
MSLVTGAQITAGPEYIEETAYGELPAMGSFSFIGVAQSFDPRADLKSLLLPSLGSRDLRSILKAAAVYDLRLEYMPYNVTFAKYGVNAAAGAGTIEKSLSIRTKLTVAGGIRVIDALGSRINSITLTGRVGEPLMVSCDVWCKQIPDYMTEPAGSLDDATDPGTEPLMFSSGGANPVTIGSDTPDVREVAVTVENNLERVHVLGATEVKYLPYQARRVSATLTLLLREGVYYGYAVGDTFKTVTWTLQSGSPAKTLTLGNAKLTRLESMAFKPTELVVERWRLEAKTANLTDT